MANIENIETINRIELIDEVGRLFYITDIEIIYALRQDNNETLKLIVVKKESE